MGIAAYFRQIKEEVIAEEVAKAVAEEVAKAVAEEVPKALAEGLSQGRQRTIDELRAMPTHEVLALLERQDADAAPAPETPPNDNGQPPPA